jgi:hypothetical protein
MDHGVAQMAEHVPSKHEAYAYAYISYGFSIPSLYSNIS